MLKAIMKFEIATAVSIGSVGTTGPLAETDSKQKQIIITKQNGVRDNNPRITRYYIQRGLTRYNKTDPSAKKTDSRQRDRLNTIDCLYIQAWIYKNSVSPMLKNACQTLHPKMYQMLPAGGALYILAVSEPSKSNN